MREPGTLPPRVNFHRADTRQTAVQTATGWPDSASNKLKKMSLMLVVHFVVHVDVQSLAEENQIRH
jgi:hypothetical protein